MRTVTRARRLERPDDDGTERRWRLGFYIVLSCAVLIALAAFAQQPPTEVSIRPTGPMPSVGVP
jgi:hypothetical protein